MSHGNPMITLTRGRFGTPASRVMEEVRDAGPVARDAIAGATGLSVPTINRTVTAHDPKTGELRAEARTRLLRFVDDVVVRVSAASDGATLVDVASASRVGRADFGANGRRIARFLHGLRGRLAERAG